MTPAVDRFLSKVDKTDSCWLWNGRTTPSGYGNFRVGGRQVPAHRWAYENFVGPIPSGLQIDHLCRVRNCVNPAHMEPVTSAENTRRGMAPNHVRHRNRLLGIGSCANHEYSDRRKKCLTCQREYEKRKRIARNALHGAAR